MLLWPPKPLSEVFCFAPFQFYSNFFVFFFHLTIFFLQKLCHHLFCLLFLSGLQNSLSFQTDAHNFRNSTVWNHLSWYLNSNFCINRLSCFLQWCLFHEEGLTSSKSWLTLQEFRLQKVLSALYQWFATSPPKTQSFIQILNKCLLGTHHTL